MSWSLKHIAPNCSYKFLPDYIASHPNIQQYSENYIYIQVFKVFLYTTHTITYNNVSLDLYALKDLKEALKKIQFETWSYLKLCLIAIHMALLAAVHIL